MSDLVVTNATPTVGAQRGSPVPFILFSEKLNGGLKDDEGPAKVGEFTTVFATRLREATGQGYP